MNKIFAARTVFSEINTSTGSVQDKVELFKNPLYKSSVPTHRCTKRVDNCMNEILLSKDAQDLIPISSLHNFDPNHIDLVYSFVITDDASMRFISTPLLRARTDKNRKENILDLLCPLAENDMPYIDEMRTRMHDYILSDECKDVIKNWKTDYDRVAYSRLALSHQQSSDNARENADNMSIVTSFTRICAIDTCMISYIELMMK